MKYWPFMMALRSGGDNIAIADTVHDVSYTYRHLLHLVEVETKALAERPRGLILLFARNDVPSVVCYLAAQAAGHAVFVSPVGMGHASSVNLMQRYRPELVLWKDGPMAVGVSSDYREIESLGGYRAAQRCEIQDAAPHASLGVVLSTSGSSGSAKAVRLPAAGLESSAEAVAEALNLGAGVRALANLPFAYVYGLSVLNSALCSGATTVLVSGSVSDRAFWGRVADANVTMIPTVSQTLALMRRYGVDATRIPTLRKVTHSGDALEPDLFSWAHERMNRHGVELYLMYGQTEAGGRMTVLQPGCLPDLHGSVGVPLRSCEVRIDANGEILFRGPGVMLGYAHERDDLVGAGMSGEFLRTGDLGHLDERGFLYVRGRLSRDRKIFGKRINLDEVAGFVRGGAQVAVVENGGTISIIFEENIPGDTPSQLDLSRYFQLPPQIFRVQSMARLPCTARGKVALEVLTEMMSGPGWRLREPN
jgi:acyl-coenzyme A synthetase/AMP-(fatty) acid ligase